jgi:hypothetical protein
MAAAIDRSVAARARGALSLGCGDLNIDNRERQIVR